MNIFECKTSLNSFENCLKFVSIRVLYTSFLGIILLFSSTSLFSQSIYQTMACADDDGGRRFYHRVPAGSQLTAVTVWAGKRVDGITFAYRTPEGNAQEVHIGGYGGNRNTTFHVSRNVSIVGMNLRCGDRVDNIQFVFSDGSTSPSYGGGGGSPTSLTLPRGVKFRGFYGREGDEVDQIGMLYSY